MNAKIIGQTLLCTIYQGDTILGGGLVTRNKLPNGTCPSADSVATPPPPPPGSCPVPPPINPCDTWRADLAKQDPVITGLVADCGACCGQQLATAEAKHPKVGMKNYGLFQACLLACGMSDGQSGPHQ